MSGNNGESGAGEGPLSEKIQIDSGCRRPNRHRALAGRLERAFNLLPEEVRSLLMNSRAFTVVIRPDPAFLTGVRTAVFGPRAWRRYEITVFEGLADWSEAVFIGAFLRELGHVAAQRPPENEWPKERRDRALFKERIECVADAMVWNWGLKEYSTAHISAVYTPHRVPEILADVEKTAREIVPDDAP